MGETLNENGLVEREFPPGSIAAMLSADEIETALRTLGEVWSAHGPLVMDPHDELSGKQKLTAGLVADYWKDDQ